MAANTRISYNVGLNVDVKQAKAQMQDLLTTVNKLSTISLDSFDTSALKDGVATAKQLETVLHRAFNVNTGNLDLGKFSSSLKQAGLSVNDLNKRLTSIGPTGQLAFNQLVTSVANAQMPLKQTSTMLDNLLINLKKTAQWQISSTIIHGVVGQIESAIGYVKNLNKSLTDIAIVSDLSSQELAKFATRAHQLGKSLSTSTLDVTNAALIYFQQGDNVLQSMEKAAITIKAANASANSSAAEMSEYLTAIWNSYQVGSQELEKYVDMMAALGAKTASSMEEIATAMQKVAATANTVGVGFDQMSSIISTVSSVTRESAESIGTSYKTILARIGDLKMGNLVEDGVAVTLGQVSGQLQKMGVNILDAKGNMRDMGSVIEEIGAKWQGMNEAQKAAVAQTIAGKRQYTQLMALFENWDSYQANLTITDESEGALDEMQNKWAEGWEAASNRVRNSMEGIWSSFINDKAVVTVLNVFAEIINGIDTVIDKMGGFGSVIALVGGTLASKLGNRTHEFVDSIKTNLGLATGEAKRQLVQMQTEMAKVTSAGTTDAQKMEGRHQTALLTANARYNANQDHLSMGQRENYQMHLESLKQKQAEETQLALQARSLEAQNQRQSTEIVSDFADSGIEVAAKQARQTIAEIDTELNNIAARKAEIEAKISDGLDISDAESQEYDRMSERQAELAQQRADAQKIAEQELRTKLQDAGVDVVDIDAWFNGSEEEAAAAGERIAGALVGAINKNIGTTGSLNFTKTMRNNFKAAMEQSAEEMQKAQTESSGYFERMAKEEEITMSAKSQANDLFENLGTQNTEQYQQVLSELSHMKGVISEEGSFEIDVTAFEDSAEGFQQLQALVDAVIQKFDQMEAAAERAGTAAEDALGAVGQQEQARELANTASEQAETDTRLAENDAEQQNLQDTLEIDATPIYTASDALVGLGAGALSAFGAVQSLVGAWQTIQNPDASGWEKFTAVLMGLAGAISGVNGAMTALKTISTFFEQQSARRAAAAAGEAAGHVVNTGALGANTAALGVNRTFSQAWNAAKGNGLKSIFKFITALFADKAALVADTAATGAATTATIGLQLAKLGLVGAIIAAGALLVAGAVALIKWAADAHKTAAELEADMIQLSEQSAALENQQKSNMNTMVSLASVVADTSMTVEEQTEKINELTSAYGIQASALDILSGKYGKLNEQIVAQMKAEQDAINAEQKAILAQQADTAIARMNKDLDEHGGFLGLTVKGDNILDQWGTATEDENNRLKEFFAQNAEALNAMNFYYDAENGRIGALGDIDTESYIELYRMLDEAGAQSWGPKGGYFDNMMNQMEDGAWNLDDLIATEERIRQGEQLSAILDSDSFELFNLDGEVETLEEVQALMQEVGATSIKDQEYLLNYLSQFEHYNDAVMQMQGLNELASSTAEIYGGNVDPEKVKEGLMKQIGDQGLDLDVLLHINPTDIVWDEAAGQWVATELALKIAQAQKDLADAQADQVEIKSLEDMAKQDSLTRADYESLQDSELFSEKELDEFVTSSPAARLLMLEEKQKEAEAKELEALQTLVTDGETQVAEYKEAKEEYLNGLSEAVNNNAALRGKYGDTEGQELYDLMQAEKASLQKQKDYMSNYGNISKFEDIEDQDAYKQAALAAMSAEERALYAGKSAEEIFNDRSGWGSDIGTVSEISAELDTLNGVLLEGETIIGSYSDAQAALAESQGDLEAAEWWATTGKAIETATTAVEAFNDAIGQSGKMSAKNLAQLQILDSNALNNYQSMSSSQWDAYAYEQTMNYYDELLALYDKDSIDYITTLEAKEAATTEYYNSVRDRAKANAENIAELYEEEVKAIQEALDQLNGIDFEKGLSELGLDGIEKLRQALMEVYDDAELVDQMIRNIGKEKAGSKEAAIALADAKTALALKGHEATVEQQQEAAGLISMTAALDHAEPPLVYDGTDLTVHANNGEAGVEVSADPSSEFDETTNGLVPKTDDGESTIDIISDTTNAPALNTNGTLKYPNPTGNGVYNITVGKGEASASLNVDTTTGAVSLIQTPDGTAIYGVSLDGPESGAFYIDSTTGAIMTSSIDDAGNVTYGTVLDASAYSAVTVNEDGGITISGINTVEQAAEVQAALGDGANVYYDENLGQYIVTAQATATNPAQVNVNGVNTDGHLFFNTQTQQWEVKVDTTPKTQQVYLEYVDKEAQEKVTSGALKSWSDRRDVRIKGTSRDGWENDKVGTFFKTDSGYDWMEDWSKYYSELTLSEFLKVGRTAKSGGQTTKEAYESTMSRLGREVLGTSVLNNNGQINYDDLFTADNEGFVLMTDMMAGYAAAGYDVADAWRMMGEAWDAADDIIGGGDKLAEDFGTLEEFMLAWADSFDSEDKLEEMGESGRNMVAGYIQGLAEGTPEAIAICQALGYESLAALQAALQEHSPSEATRKFGHFLVEGLNIGVQETEFDAGPLGQTVLEKIKAELDKVDMKQILEESGIDGILDFSLKDSDELDTEKMERYLAILNEIRQAQGLNTFESWEEVEKSGILTGEQGQLLAADIERRDALANSNYSIKQTANGKFQIVDATGEAIDGILYDTMEAAENAIIRGEWTTAMAPQEIAEYFTNGFWNDDTYTDTQKVIMETIRDEAKKKAAADHGFDPNDDQAFADWIEQNSAEWLTYVNAEYENYQSEMNSAVDLSWAQIKQTWKDALADCQEIDEEAAEQTYERWVTTWEAIGKARIAALQGEDGSLADQWSEDEQLEMARRMQQSGMGLEEIVSTQLSGSYDLDASYLKLGSYASSGRGQMSDLIGLNMGPFGMPTNTTLDEYKRNTEAYWTAWANDSLSTSEFFSHTGDYEKAANLMYTDDGTLKSQETFLTEWATSLGKTVEQLTDAEREAALSYRETAATLVGGGALVKGDNGYKLNGDKDDIVEIYVDEKIELSDEQWEENYNEAIAAGAASRIKYQTDYKAQMVDETEAEITRLESDQAIIQKAMEQGLESLSPEEFADYERIMEEGGYATLSEANLGLASEMDATASSLARMRFAIENGYTVADDGTWVKPTEIKSTKSEATYTQEEAMAQTHGWQVSTDDPSQYTMVQAFEGEDGKYYIVTSTASVDSLGATDSDTFIAGTSGAKTSSEYSDAAQDYNFEYYAEQAEMTADEFKTYAEVLNTTTNGQQMFNTKTAEGREALYNYASAVAKSEKGFEELQAITKDTWKELNDESKKGSRNWTKNIAGLRSTMSKLFNTDMKHITAKFVEDHLDELEKMATGTEEEAAAAQEAIQDDLVAAVMQADGLEATTIINAETGEAENALTYFQTALDQWDGKEVGFTINADTAGAEANVIATMQNILDAGTMTADQITAALNAIGWEPEITWETIQLDDSQIGSEYATVVDSAGKSHTVKVTEEMRSTKTVKIPVIGSAKKISAPGGGSRITPSGGGGGGGGGDPKKIDKKKPEDEKERYHESEQTLERLADELEKVDKLKSRAYGKGHLDAIKQEISLLKQEVGVQADYLKQAQEYLALDRNRVASLGATFNADGTISNYDELMDSIIAKYNAFVDKYNSSSAKQQEDMEEEKEQMDKWYEESMEWISQYEETLNLTRDKENEILELQNEISAKTLEGIQYKVEFEVELNEEEADFLDYLNEKYGEVLEKQDTLVENLVRQQQLAQENLASLNTAKAELDEKYASGELTQADYITGLQDINDQILDNLSTLQDLRKEIQEAYGNALDMATEAIDNHTEKMEHASQAMQSYISIMGLIGQGVDYEKLADFYDNQYQYNLKSLETQQAYLDTLKEEQSYFLAKMAAGELTETEREQFEALQDTIAEVEDGILSKTEETLTALREAFSVAVEGILKDFEESIAGAGNSLEDLSSDYEYYLEVQERHVSTSKELYEVSKLNRQIEQDIAESSSSLHKQRLAALQEEIKAKSADRALTEYDIQMMNLEYELLQRQMALEEAKNAKDTVRLTRDSSGNYVYQYTANQDAVNEAQQGVEDVLQRMAEANAERVGQLEQETISAYQDMVAQIEEIANSEVLTQEEKNAKIAEIVERTQEKMSWIQEQYTIATENTASTYELIQEQYGANMANAAQMTKDSMNGTIGEIIAKTNEFSLNMSQVQADVAEQLSLLHQNMDAVLTTTKWDQAAESIEGYDLVIEDAEKDAQKMISTLGGEGGLLDKIKDTTSAWDAQAAAIDGLIDYYEDLYQAILKIQQTESTKAPATPNIPAPSTPSDENNDPAPENGPEPEEEPARSYPYGKASETSGKIKSGAKGDKVRAIQYALNELGYGNSGTNSLDGIFGSGTKKAVKAFQKANGITADGVVGNSTREKFKMLQFLTGGLVDYTGPAWVDGSKDRPELMLNATDTQNMLAAVQTVRSLDIATLNMLDDFIKLAASSMLSANSLHASSVANKDETLQQEVHITAEFPNVQDSHEIQDAFDNLINRATQFVGSMKKY